MNSEPLFESTPAQPDHHIDPGSYAHALYGLHHDRGIAENMFARRAKTDFEALFKEIPKLRLTPTEESEVFPLWVDQMTYAIRLKDLPTSPKDPNFISAAQPLEAMVVMMADKIINTYDGKRLILVGALQVRVQNLGGGKFSFSLKQKWGFDA